MAPFPVEAHSFPCSLRAGTLRALERAVLPCLGSAVRSFLPRSCFFWVTPSRLKGGGRSLPPFFPSFGIPWYPSSPGVMEGADSIRLEGTNRKVAEVSTRWVEMNQMEGAAWTLSEGTMTARRNPARAEKVKLVLPIRSGERSIAGGSLLGAALFFYTQTFLTLFSPRRRIKMEHEHLTQEQVQAFLNRTADEETR